MSTDSNLSNLDWWKEHLAGASSIQLPTDYARPLNKAHVEREEILEPSPEICKRILRLSLDMDCTPFTLILGIFLVTLHKYSLEEDIIIGSSSSSTNAQVMRLAIRGDMTFRDVVAAVQGEEEKTEEHEIDFSKLMAALRTPDSGDEALCQVRFFNMADVRQETLEAVGTCDWSVFVEQKSDAKRILPLRIRVSYNSLLFSQVRMNELLNQIQFVTDAITKNDGIVVDDISLLTPFANDIVPDPAEHLDDSFFGSIQSVFNDRAKAHPDRVFIYEKNGEVTYTYKQVNDLASQVANFLVSSAKIQVEDVVAIYAHRSAPLVVAVMGVLRAGATVCIIDPQYPAKRQITYLEVARPKALVVLESAGNLLGEVKEYLEKTPEIRSILRGLNMDASKIVQLADVPTTDPDIKIGPENISTLSFTSGSTGIPKGCKGRAISLTHFYPWMGEEFNLGEKDRFTMLSGIAHDPIQRDIFTPIFFAASLHIPAAEEILEPGRLADWCARNEVTITVLTPAMGQLLTADAVTPIPSLKHAFFVGDVLAKRDVIRLQQLSPNVKVVNMMGSTETQRSVSFLTILNDKHMMNTKEILPAGRGMKDVQLLVLNNRMKMAGIGEVGELFIRSHHMAAGYLGRDEETKAKFLPNPFVEEDKRIKTDRIYKTGDMGRYLPSGIVECMGRRDDQVKIRGFRIELREIDTFLVQHPTVREAVTMLRRDVNEEHRLIAYFVPLQANEYDIDTLRAHLREKLPKYAIPSDFVPLVKMPLNPNGKIDKGRLPFPDTAQSHMSKKATDTKDLTPLQRVLHRVWCEALGRPNLSITDNFFDFGGHSVLATRVIFKMRQALQVDIPLNLLYDFPTIETLAAMIERQKGDGTSMILVEDKEKDTPKVKELDLKAEVVLDESIKPGKPFEFPSTINGVFLTGATGFLGAFLLHDILTKHVDAKVHCLVRASDDAAAKERLLKNLRVHYLYKEKFDSRIVAHAGDLGKDAFGLSKETYDELAKSVDVIVHNGAMVHWVFPYAQLKAPNVGGTVEALRLACAGGKVKPMHFVSSTSVLDTEHYVGMDIVPEDDNLDAAASALKVGYAQSKWVSEKIVMLARERGMPVTITRPGYIVGSSYSGVSQSDDFLWRLMKGCIELKLAPQMLNRVNCCSVDYVSSLIVTIMSSPEALGKAYHTYNPAVFRFNDFFAAAKEHGWEMEQVDYLQWRDTLKEKTLDSNDSALYPLLHFVLDDLPTRSLAPRLDNSNSMALPSMNCPPMVRLMPKILSYLVQSGFLPKPSQTDATALPELPIKDIVAMDKRMK